MEKKGTYLLAGGLAAFFSLVGLMSFAYAAEDVDTVENGREEITLSPVTKKYEIAAGDSTRGSFTVLNTGDVEFSFIVYAKPYSVSGSNYDANYSDESAPRADAYDWVVFDTAEGTLAPQESMEIGYTVDMPLDAGLGGHYAVLFAETQPSEDVEGNQIIRKKRVGSVLRVNVSGDINEQGSVVGSTIPGFISSPPLKTTLDVKNDGNVDFTVLSSIKVSDVFGNTKYSNQKVDTIVYPDTTRSIEQNWDGASWLGLYKVDISAKYLDQGYQTSKYVLIVPRWLIALTVILIAGGAYAAFARSRH